MNVAFAMHLIMTSICYVNKLYVFQAPPKAVPKTIENQRVYDETTVDPNDEEVTACANKLTIVFLTRDIN